MDGRTDGRTKIPPVFYRTSSPSGPLPIKLVFPLFDSLPWTDGPTDEWANERMDVRRDGRMDGRTEPLIELRVRNKKRSYLPIGTI